MAPSSKFFVLFFALFVVAATLQPSEARVPGLKAAAANQEASEPAVAGNQQVPEPSSKAAAAVGEAAQPSTWPGFPGFPPLLGLPFTPLLPGFPFPPSQPLLGFPGLFPPLTGLPGAPPHLGFPGLPGSAPSPPQPKECLTPLMGVMPCMDYLTNTSVLTPPSTCCDGYKSLINSAPICLCHGMNGGMNTLLPKPILPLRMMFLPVTCGTMPPIQTFFMCSTQPVPPLMPPGSPAPASPAVSPSSEVSP